LFEKVHYQHDNHILVSLIGMTGSGKGLFNSLPMQPVHMQWLSPVMEVLSRFNV